MELIVLTILLFLILGFGYLFFKYIISDEKRELNKLFD